MSLLNAAGVMIINSSGQYLLVKRSSKAPHHAGQWESVGGKLSDSEDF